MSSQKTHADATGAADKSIGFDFQYYYFLNALLSLKKGENVGLEVRDDVHTELSNQHQILVQVKHTTQTAASGNAINLTTYDGDLWKTMFNWSKVISDPAEGRDSEKAQLDFIGKTTFCLATNKSQASTNKLIAIVEGVCDGSIAQSQVKQGLESLRKGTKDAGIQAYIDAVLSLSSKALYRFLEKVRFESDIEDIIQDVKNRIEEKAVPPNRIESAFHSLDSAIRTDNFINIKNGVKLVISFDDFMRKYRRHLDIARSPTLAVKKTVTILPDDLKDQVFIAQLCDIGDISLDDVEIIAEYTRCKLSMTNNLEAWHQEGDITGQEKEAFHDEAKKRWKPRFHSKYRGVISEDTIASKALEIVDDIRLEKLSLALTELSTDMCNGEFYHLSDIPEIGWHKDWEDKYK